MLYVAKSQRGGPAGLFYWGPGEPVYIPHRPPRWVFVVSAVGRCVVFGLFWFLGLHFISEAIIVVVRRPGRAGFFLWVRALSCSEMTERRVPCWHLPQRRTRSFKNRVRGADRPNLQHADCGFLTTNGGFPRGRAGCPPAAQLQDHQSPEGRGIAARAWYGMWWLFFSAEASCPPSNRPACTRTNARLTRRTGGLGLGRSSSSSGQATDTVVVLRPELGLVLLQPRKPPNVHQRNSSHRFFSCRRRLSTNSTHSERINPILPISENQLCAHERGA